MTSRSNDSDDYASLYERARSGDADALLELYVVILRLLRWSLRDDGIVLPPWEVEEICEDAFVVLLRCFSQLATWPQAWKYVEKTAISRARRVVDRSRNVLLLEPERASALNPEKTPEKALEVRDVVERFLQNKDGPQGSLLKLIVDCCRHGDCPTTKLLVERSGLSSRTLRRRLASLRKGLGPWLSP